MSEEYLLFICTVSRQRGKEALMGARERLLAEINRPGEEERRPLHFDI